MSSSGSTESEKVARYFDSHAVDFDTIYEQDKGAVRKLRDRLSRGTVLDRLPFVMRVAGERSPSSILDVGCGAGRFAIPLAKTGATVTGLDFAEEMIALAERAADQAGTGSGCTFLCEDVMAWDPRVTFDMAIAIGVFDYVSDAAPLLARIASFTAGTIVVSFPKRAHPLVPIRWVRLRLAGCPVFFYTRWQIEELASGHLSDFTVTDLRRDLMLVGTTRSS